MAPPSAEYVAQESTIPIHVKNGDITKGSTRSPPLKYSGTLDSYESFDVTHTIGREFPKAQLTEILKDDAKIRDLAIIVAQRGVVFFRNQDIEIEEQKVLGQRLGELTGKPATSKLHKHALLNSDGASAADENGKADGEVTQISSEAMRKFYGDLVSPRSTKLASNGWHSDISFEHVPSDYSILKMVQIPEDAGGDTLWASGYEAYDRLSPFWRTFSEGLTATHNQPILNKVAKEQKIDLLDEGRGSPENTGIDFKAVHPVIRTHPITGWKSLYAACAQLQAGWINGVTERESDILKAYFSQLISENHDLQVRFRWNKNDVAIWDNRSTYHTATNDYEGKRNGDRVCAIGEVPYYDPNSVSRREALARA